MRLARALTPQAARRMVRLAPGVDATVFRPGAGGGAVRDRLGLAGRPVVVCVSRLVPRKGQDTLIPALPQILAEVSGGGAAARRRRPVRAQAQRLAAAPGVADDGALHRRGPVAELPATTRGDVFAMPCRTRRGGLDVEGLGIVYLEASATGLPVVGGDSGGAPDAVLDGETGYVVPRRGPALAGRVTSCSPTRPGPRRWARRAGPGSTANGGATSRAASRDPVGLTPAKPRAVQA